MAAARPGVYIYVMDKPRAPGSPRRQAAIALIGSVAITLAMFLIPSPQHTWWLLAPFRWLHIYVHEFGHGVAALLAGGAFDKFEMYSYSGLAHTRTSGAALTTAFVCAGGLCGPALVGGIFLGVGRWARLARAALFLFGAFMALSLVLWTRTAFGWGFGAAVAALSISVALFARPAIAQAVLVFLGTQLALSVYTGGGYLFTKSVEIQNGHVGPSDTQAMADAIGGTYWIWGAVCGGFSVAVLLCGLWLYIRPSRASRKAALIAA